MKKEELKKEFYAGSVVITKDNIYLYYEFMSDYDKFVLANANTIENALLREVLIERNKTLNGYFSFSSFQDNFDNVKTIDYEHNKYSNRHTTIGRIYFGIVDTLKPIDEYIEEIKASSEYKEYIATK